MGTLHLYGYQRPDRSHTLVMRQGDFSELLNPNNIFITRKNSAGNKIPVDIADLDVALGLAVWSKKVPLGLEPSALLWLLSRSLAKSELRATPKVLTLFRLTG